MAREKGTTRSAKPRAARTREAKTREGRLRAARLRQEVLRANQELARSGLVMGTFGNVSGVDGALGLMAIKPSGVPYERLRADDIVLVALESGEIVDSRLRPSSDTPTHLALYRAFRCGGVVHTHSEHATALAQAELPVRCLGTTHADHFRGDVPVTRALRADEVERDYEANTGLVIVETFETRGISPEEIPAVLVASHGPFAWGDSAATAVENAVILEYLARMEVHVRAIAPDARGPAGYLVDRHFLRKRGPGATYGQKR